MTCSNAKTGERNLAFVVYSPSCFFLGSWLGCILISPSRKCLALPHFLVCVVAGVAERRSKVELEGNFHGGEFLWIKFLSPMWLVNNKDHTMVSI